MSVWVAPHGSNAPVLMLRYDVWKAKGNIVMNVLDQLNDSSLVFVADLVFNWSGDVKWVELTHDSYRFVFQEFDNKITLDVYKGMIHFESKNVWYKEQGEEAVEEIFSKIVAAVVR